MKGLFVFLALVLTINSWSVASDLDKMRDLFSKVDEAESYNIELYQITKSATQSQPIAYGYQALYYFMNAKYTFWPGDKFANFAKGKDRIEAIIKRYPNEAELRLIRYSVQYNVPSLLNYSQDLSEDRKILQRAAFMSKYASIRHIIQGVLKRYP